MLRSSSSTFYKLTDSLTHWLTHSLPVLKNTTKEHTERRVTLETCYQSDEETWPDKQTLPEAQRTQGIDSLTWVISPAKKNTTCIGFNCIGQYVMQFALVPILAPGGATCISCKISHQMAPFALITNFPTRSSHLHCHSALECPIGSISWYWVGIFISQSRSLGIFPT